ncbi:Evolutionarily conserved signaling intermediate in Toll pathway [Schistosoma japonicum]|uniref:Evolutionarily conserved signaling intermediate in Toll pathway n=1 Tax=Schistosoma japonicum TaxID=6182 RepID=A0A4Z2DUG6_SCHJA|nr:Evolutionarily conserved signaling intermediate in Toll pathway [Schistosoma japonicum]
MMRNELLPRLRLLTVLRRVSVHENRLNTMKLLIPVASRSASFFSFIRSKFGKTTSNQSKESQSIPNDGEWLNAVRDAERSELLHLKGSETDITRTELRKWKKRAFLHILEMFIQRSGPTRKGYFSFIQHALTKMLEYETFDDLECYKAIIRLFPTGRMTVTRYFQSEFIHYPRHQQLLIDLLNQMARYHVLPDDEVGQLIINVFGYRSHAMQHYRRLMYWMPKLYHCNPWPLPQRITDDLDIDPIKLGWLIAERICPDRMTEFTVVQTSSSISSSSSSVDRPDSLISAQSPEQRALLAYCAKRIHNNNNNDHNQYLKPIIYLDGPHYVWFRNLQATYYTLWTEIDADRLKKEIATVKANQVPKYSAEEPYNLSFFNSNDSSNIVLNDPSSPIDSLLSHMSLLPAVNPTGTEQLQSRDEDIISTKFIANCEPEFDKRWLSIRQGHVYKYLPSNLCQHEQGDGTILAIGVVVPKPDALDNQKKLCDWEISNKMRHTNLKESEQQQQSQYERLNLPQVPLPASPVLIRLWLNELRAKNPFFDDVTLVIRVPMNIEQNKSTNNNNNMDNSENQDNNDLKYKSYI